MVGSLRPNLFRTFVGLLAGSGEFGGGGSRVERYAPKL